MIFKLGLLEQVVEASQVSKWITGVPFKFTGNPKRFSINRVIFLIGALTSAILSSAYLWTATNRVWKKEGNSFASIKEECYVVLEFLLGISLLTVFHLCITPYWYTSEGENLIDQIVKLEERHLKLETQYVLTPKEKKIIASTKVAIFVLSQSMIRGLPILAGILSVLVEDIPFNVFQYPPFSLAMSVITFVMDTLNPPSLFINAVRFTLLPTGNMLLWGYMTKGGISTIMNILFGSVSLTLFLSNLQRYNDTNLLFP